MTNLILATDSYKQSHFLQYPPETRRVSAYVEARTNDFNDHVLFFGLQAYLKEYLTKPVTQEDIEEAASVCEAHGVPFNREGWEIIVNEYDGFLPIEIRALPEGKAIPSSVPLVQVENTDERLPWLSTYIETALLRGIWYTSTVATLSWAAKKIIYKGLLETSDDPDGQIPFKLHDFGARGVSSAQSAALGGMAHLVNFMGTDTMEALGAVSKYYNTTAMAGFSIPAAEHSTITSWGADREHQAYANMLNQFGKKDGLVAVVSDSYDLDNAVEEIWGVDLKEKVLATGGTLVVRPDSGDPVETPIRVIEKLWEAFGGEVNSKGYKVLNPAVRVIQGDGMHLDAIEQLVSRMIEDGWSLDNIAVGMGGGLLQYVNRDTMRFAMKANAIMDENGVWHDVYKKPATDLAKTSKAGKQAVINDNGVLKAVRQDELDDRVDLLKPVFSKGELLENLSFETVRERAQASLIKSL